MSYQLSEEVYYYQYYSEDNPTDLSSESEYYTIIPSLLFIHTGLLSKVESRRLFSHVIGSVS